MDARCDAATSLGGTVLDAPQDVGPLGRVGVIADPLGSAIGLWQAGGLIGSQHVNQPGGLCWEELRSTDPTASSSFYRHLFGYDFEPEPSYPPGYLSFRLPEEDIGLGGVRPLVPDEAVPSGVAAVLRRLRRTCYLRDHRQQWWFLDSAGL